MEIQWFRHDKLASTNLCLAEMLRHGKVGEGAVVIADYQSAGKGQGRKTWLSRSGENLLMSLLLFPAFLSASQQFQLSRLVSVALCELLLSMGVKPVIKWPNDILAEGGKIAGILIEHGISGESISHTIAGIGLNLNQKVFPLFPQPASSVFLETGQSVSSKEVAENLIKLITLKYQNLKAGNGQDLEREYLDSLFRLGEPSLFEAAGEGFEGIIRGVSPYGELQVERQGRILNFVHGAIDLKAVHRNK